MKRRIAFLFLGIALYLFSGCTINNISDIQQPTQAAPGATITTYILDIFEIIDTVNTVRTAVKTDSLLVAPQLPVGWTVSSVKYSIDTAFYRHYASLAAGGSLGASTLGDVVDSLERAATMTTSTRATQFDTPLSTNYDSLHSGRVFNSFLGLKGFNVPAGTKMDTLAVQDTGQIDSTYVKLVGCFIKIVMTVGTTQKDYELGYFAGFDPNNLAPPSALTLQVRNAYKDSTLITISNTAVKQAEFAVSQQALCMNIAPNPLRTSAAISYYVPQNLNTVNAQLSIYDMRGTVQYADLLQGSSGWNRYTLSTGKPGSSLPDGTYLCRLTSGNTTVTRQITISRKAVR